MTRLFKLLIGAPAASRPAASSTPGALSAAVVWIALVLLSVQILRPFRYAYEYESSVVLSGNRLRQLHTFIDASGQGEQGCRITLRAAAQSAEGRPDLLTQAIPNLHARGVTIRCLAPASAAQLAQILSSASFVQDVEAAESLRKAARWNRHCIEVYEHQLASSRRNTGSVSGDRAKAPTVKLASTSSLSRSPFAGQTPSSVESLEAKLQALRNDQSELDRKLTQRRSFAAGVLSVSKPWQIHVTAAHTDRIRLIAALIGSLAAAFTARGLSLPMRLVVRRRTRVDVLRRQLAAIGIDVLPEIGQHKQPSPARSEHRLATPLFDWVYRVSKGLIVLAVALAAARLLFDPLWRDLCLDSPLAAISSLLELRIGRT